MAIPDITTNRLIAIEGLTVDIFTDDINATATDASGGPVDPTNISFLIEFDSEAALAGEFQLNGAPTTTFTLDDIENNRVDFEHDGTNNTPQYRVIASATADGVTESSDPLAAVVEFTPINDAPTFELNALSIAEGETVTLGTENLQASDEPGESTAAELTYTIQSVSANGQFLVGDTVTTSLTVGDTFTQADVEAGLVQFQHDGSETAPTYTLTLTDSGVEGTGPFAEPIETNPRRVNVVSFTPVNDAPSITTSTITLTEDTTVTLGPGNISAEDIDEPNEDNLIFTVTSVTNGRFERVTTVDGVEQVDVLAAPDLADPQSFTQGEIFAGQIQFVNEPGTDTTPTFELRVDDTGEPILSDTTTGTVNFTTVNDLPTLDTLSIALEENEQLTLTAENLSVSDEESAAENLTYQVTDLSSSTSFIRLSDGTTTTTFTQADIDSGTAIALQHNGSTVEPSFSLTVTDEGGKSIILESSQGLTFGAINDEPIVVRSQFDVTEGQTVGLTAADNLLATDEESLSGQLVYTVTIDNSDRPDNPDRFIVADVEQTGDVVTFTQAQVGAGQVEFRHGGSNLAPNLTMTLTDEATGEGIDIPPEQQANIIPVNLEVGFTATNDAPLFLTNTLEITEGSTVVLNADRLNLNSTDEETADSALTYTINSVEFGSFQRLDTDPVTELVVGDTFTQGEVDQGFIQFTHDGGELPPTYRLTVTDTGLADQPDTALSVARSVTIPPDGFTQVNDAPTFANNSFDLTEGETVTLTLNDLSATDPEDADDNLIFTVTDVSNGRFERVVGGAPPEVLAAPDLATPLTFTQAEIDAGTIRFVNDPAVDTTPTYTVQVQDLDVDNPGVTAQTGTVNFTPVNDDIELTTLSFTLMEEGFQTLTASVLSVVDEETPPEGINYTVNAVDGGSFVFVADGSPADSFTQADINAGNVIRFQHGGSNDAPTFTLTATDGVNELTLTETLNDGVTFTPTNDLPTVETSAFAITEGGSVTLSGVDNLSTTDEESDSAGLLYTVAIDNTGLEPGELNGFLVADELLTSTATFTQAQVNLGQVSFVHGGSNVAPNLTMTVTDEPVGEDVANVVEVPLEVDFTPINDAPNFVTNTLEIAEGGTVVLSDTDNLVVNDEESEAASLTYTINSVENGEFQRLDDPENPTAIPTSGTFTQADVAAGLIQFAHDGGEEAPDYTLTVTDSGLVDVPDSELSVTRSLIIPDGGFENVNDVPIFQTNTLTLTEGEAPVLSLDNLSATDVEDDDAELIYTVTEVTNGRFERVTTVDGMEQVDVLAAPDVAEPRPFTQAEIEAGLIRFVHDPATDTAPSYTVQVQDLDADDPGITVQTGTVNFTAINDVPVLETLNLTLTEGDTVTLTTDVLSVSDEETLPEGITYSVNTAEGGSFIRLADGSPADTFTQADLIAGNVVAFEHDGLNDAPTFSLTVTDTGEVVNTITITSDLGDGVTFTPTNDAPVVEASSFAVTEGASVPLTAELLRTSDEESPPEALVYTVTINNADPDNPEALKANPDGFEINGELLTGPEVTFTQADIDAGLVTFVHGGSNLAPDISATVTDTFPEELGGPTTVDVELTIDFTAINDAPVVTNNVLVISEGEELTLTPDILLVSDEETPATELTYTVNATTNGSFQQVNPGTEEATAIAVDSTFTQADINDGVIEFVHDGGETAPSYTLTVADTALVPDGPVNTLTIDSVIPEGGFTNVNDPPTIENNTLTITEGETVTFSSTQLSASDPDSVVSQLQVSFSEISGGVFFLDGNELAAGDTFTAGAIAFGELEFVDDGDDFAPSYNVTISDGIDTVTETATIVFTPVNDAPEITTNSFTITEGRRLTLNDPTTPGTLNLVATDSETPDDLLFTVSDVQNGEFFQVVGFEAVPVSSFTLETLNNGDINFEHNGSEEAPSFQITVSDPENATATVTASVTFVPVNDAPTLEVAQLAITEGATEVLTTASFLANDVDSSADDLTFIVSELEGGEFTLANSIEETISGEFSGSLSLTDEQVATALADGLYINLHTENFPSGELRGQIDLEAAGVAVTGVLEEAQEVDMVPDTEATGTFSAVLDGTTLQITGSYSGLTSPLQPVGGVDAAGNPETAIHVHVGAAGENGPILQNLLVNEIVPGTGSGTTSFTQADLIAGLVQFTDDGDQTAPSLNVSVSDGEFATDPVAVEIIDFINTNDPPMAIADSGAGFDTDEVTAFTATSVLENDTDPDIPEPGDTLTVTQVNGQAIDAGPVTLESGALVTFAGDGTFEYDPNGQFTELAEGVTGTDTFTYTISDAAGATDTATVTIGITGINDAPTLDTNRLATSVGGTVVLTTNNIAVTDPDTDPSELVFTTTNVLGGQFVLNGETTTSFTQQDVLDGAVSFVQDGSETVPTYDLALSDGLANLEPSTVDVERFISVNLEAIDGGIFDYEQLLRFQNAGAPIPTDEIGGLPLVQFFDETFYLANNPDVAAAIANTGTTGYDHFIEFGLLEGRNPSALYNEAFYLDAHEDVAEDVAADLLSSGLEHFVTNGAFELRSPSAVFSQIEYLDENEDILNAVRDNAFSSGFEHYIEFGANELRDPQLFLYNEAFYLESNPDIAEAVGRGDFVDGFEHFISFGQTEGRTPSLLYDEQSYLALNPDVQAAVADGSLTSGFSHFAQIGRFEDRAVFA
jgi:hypothetical protein